MTTGFSSYTSQDILEFEDYNGNWIISQLADGSVVELTAPNELSTVTTGYNGNALGAHNEPGRQRECSIRLVKASNDDKRFNENYTLWKNRDSRFKPLKATFTKNIAHADGSMTHDKVTCYFGFPASQPTQQTDVTGNTDQVVSAYMLRFADSERTLS